MDSELVSGSESEYIGRDGGQNRPTLPFTYSKKFEELCPLYMSFGMTYDQYWNEDSTMVTMYRKAHELRQEVENQKLWLQGLYIYEALCCVTPAMRVMKPQKPIPYRSEPISLTGKSSEKPKEEQRKENSDNKAKAYMEMFAMSFNKQFEKKGG